MITTTVNDTAAVPSSRERSGAGIHVPRRGFFGRVWDGLSVLAEGRARAELARQVRLHGGRPTGDLAQDARRLATLRGMG